MSDRDALAREIAPTEGEIKLCHGCLFAKPTAWWALPFIFRRYQFAKCMHPRSLIKVDLVDGGREQLFCDVARNSLVQGRCGTEARWFQPKRLEHWEHPSAPGTQVRLPPWDLPANHPTNLRIDIGILQQLVGIMSRRVDELMAAHRDR